MSSDHWLTQDIILTKSHERVPNEQDLERKPMETHTDDQQIVNGTRKGAPKVYSVDLKKDNKFIYARFKDGIRKIETHSADDWDNLDPE